MEHACADRSCDHLGLAGGRSRLDHDRCAGLVVPFDREGSGHRPKAAKARDRGILDVGGVVIDPSVDDHILEATCDDQLAIGEVAEIACAQERHAMELAEGVVAASRPVAARNTRPVDPNLSFGSLRE